MILDRNRFLLRLPLVIQLRKVSKSFDGGTSWAIQDVTLTLQPGEWLVLLGSSGSGKSTLLKTINRLVDNFGGTVEVGNRDIRQMDPVELRRSIGYVFQETGLFPHWTVGANVAAVPRLLGWTEEKQRKRAHELLDLMGLEPSVYASRYPSQLSGGQRQRVGVARALASDPDYLLMDEPFGALDGVNRYALQQQMLALKKTLGKTVLFVTHDLFEAMTLADRLGVMHEGKLEQMGTAAELRARPATDFVRELFQRPLEQLRQAGGIS